MSNQKLLIDSERDKAIGRLALDSEKRDLLSKERLVCQPTLVDKL